MANLFIPKGSICGRADPPDGVKPSASLTCCEAHALNADERCLRLAFNASLSAPLSCPNCEVEEDVSEYVDSSSESVCVLCE